MTDGNKTFGAIGLIIAVFAGFLIFFTLMFGGSECKAAASPSGSRAILSADGTAFPIDKSKYTLTDTFGSRGGAHKGVDLAGPTGTAIFAFADGDVVKAGTASGFGHWIVVNHEIDGKKYSTVYGHMSADGVLVKEGDKVTAGQHIANVGSDGESTGPHLHFELWDGTRLGGGKAIDPWPSLEKILKEGTETDQGSDSGSDSGSSDRSAVSFNTDRLVPKAIELGNAIIDAFPEVKTIGGWREDPGFPDEHPAGRAIDVMMPYPADSADAERLGNAVAGFVAAHVREYAVQWWIWRQWIYYPDGSSNAMEDRGGATANHFDHVHINVSADGKPADGAKDSESSSSSSSRSCRTEQQSGGDVDPGKVPEEFVPWLRLGGQVCPEITPSILAGLIQVESGFRPNLTSTANARGYTQFIDTTWQNWGWKVDEQGNQIPGTQGQGDRNSPGDATMAAARYLCQLVIDVRRHQDAGDTGKWEGDFMHVVLASYNSGGGWLHDNQENDAYPDKVLQAAESLKEQVS